MAAPTTSTEIANLALDALGEDIIADIESPITKAGKAANRFYDVVRRAVLRAYAWNFAKKTVYIARTGTPVSDYSDAYTLPSDCLRLLTVGGTSDEDSETDYDLRERDICINYGEADALLIRYTFDQENVSKFDALFVTIFSLELALAIGYKITMKKSTEERLRARLAEETNKAITVDGQERVQRRRQRSKWLARRSGAGSTGVASQYYTWS